jgi:hypothetical protein
LKRGANKTNKFEESSPTMKMNSPILITAAAFAIYLGLAGSLQAVPPPPSVPDSGSTGILLGATICVLAFLKLKVKK